MYEYTAYTGSQDTMLGLAAAVYDDAISVCVQKSAEDEKFAREALVFVEGNKARMFRDQLGHSDIPRPSGLATPLIEQEQSLLQQLRAEDVKVADPDVPESRKLKLLAERRRLKERVRQVWRELEATVGAAEYVALRRSAAPDWQTLRDLAEQLGPDVAVVEFYTRNQNTLALTLRAGNTKPGVHVLPLSNSEVITRYVYTYHEEILQRPLLAYDPTHDWLNLGRELLEPLEPALAGARLVYFIPHGVLHVLPLHALTVAGEPFIARRAAAYAPSSSALARVMRRRRDLTGRASMLAMGYTERQEEREVFLGEAEDVATMFGTHALIDDEATPDNLKTRAPGASHIHLSCHGYFAPDAAMASSVLLSGGEYSALDWMRLTLSAELITISACEIGASEASLGDEVMGLTRALLYAGASTALAPLWSVNALSTREWMREFYLRITADPPTPKAQAFREATLEIRRRRPDPWYWAPFTLVGDWR
jgi:CHAT domain-containing protein